MMGSLSNYYAGVQTILSRVSSQTLHEFTCLTSDDARVAFVLQLEGVDEAFAIEKHYQPKDAEEAKKWREKGNENYQRRSLDDAINCYNTSILKAPPADTNRELALALANRSAALWQLGRHNDCLADADLALEHGYPKELQYKLFDRKGRCHQQLGEYVEAAATFSRVKDMVKESKLNEHKQLLIQKQAEVEENKCLQKIEEDGENITEKDNIQRPPHIKKTSQRFPAATSKMDIQHREGRGRYCVALETVKVGELVATEIPYMSVLDPEFYNSHCFHCMTPTNRPIGCLQCSGIRYCSTSCRKASWDSGHRFECQFLDVITTSGTGMLGHLALITLLGTGFVKIIKCKQNPRSAQADAQNVLFTDSEGVYLGGYVGIHNLMSNSEHRSPTDILQYSVLAVFLLRIVQKTGFIDDRIVQALKKGRHDVQRYIGGLLLRLVQIISCNGIEVSRLRGGTTLLKCNPQTLGLAVYPTLSLFNHSCNPNLELIFKDNRCFVRAITTAPRGQELCIDYGYLYYVTPREQRQLSLKAQYFFSCTCEACCYRWGVKSELATGIAPLRCVECGQMLPSNISGRVDPSKMYCRTCGCVQDSLSHHEIVHKSSKMFEAAMMEILTWKIKEAIPILEKHVSTMDHYVHLPWREYVNCGSLLKQSYRAMGNRDQKLTTLIESPQFESY